MNNDQKKVIVVGSGPSGFSSAKALIERGISVTMLDYGNKLNDGCIEPFTTNYNRKELLEIKDFKWSERGVTNDLVPDGIGFKKQYFYNNSNEIIDSTINSVANLSLAFGGLSNLWGGASLPVSNKDIPDWPIKNEDLKRFYFEVAKDMTISGEVDNLCNEFGPNVCKSFNFSLGDQIKDFYDDLLKNQEVLNGRGVFFGRARVAIDPSIPLGQGDFPYGPIFNSALEVQKLLKNPLFKYIPNVFVRGFREDLDEVSVFGNYKESSQEFSLKGGRLIIACGAVGTALLVASSFKMENKTILAKTNQNAFFPYFRYRRTKGVSKEIENSIAQLFIEINNELTFKRFAHIQVYQYGDYVLEPIKRILKGFTPLFSRIMNSILERLVIMQAMLHSDFSDELELKVVCGTDGRYKLNVVGVKNKKARQGYKKLLKAINKILPGGRAFRLGMFIDPPGASNHIGGTFPMREIPRSEKNESDIWGRIKGLEKVHIVDSSILPSLPAPTITFTVMANAVRIAQHVGESLNGDHV